MKIFYYLGGGAIILSLVTYGVLSRFASLTEESERACPSIMVYCQNGEAAERLPRSCDLVCRDTAFTGVLEVEDEGRGTLRAESETSPFLVTVESPIHDLTPYEGAYVRVVGDSIRGGGFTLKNIALISAVPSEELLETFTITGNGTTSQDGIVVVVRDALIDEACAEAVCAPLLLVEVSDPILRTATTTVLRQGGLPVVMGSAEIAFVGAVEESVTPTTDGTTPTAPTYTFTRRAIPHVE